MINENKRIVQFSEKFCRDIVENSLNNLLFFHVNFQKYANLVSKFLLSCDKRGNFEIDVPIPEEFVFVNDEITTANLVDCRKRRNSLSWFIHCAKICENF